MTKSKGSDILALHAAFHEAARKRQKSSVITMAKNAVAAAVAAAKNPKRLSEEERAHRLAICKACEFYRRNERHPLLPGSCLKCGCRLKWKTLLEAWHCPIAKW